MGAKLRGSYLPVREGDKIDRYSEEEYYEPQFCDHPDVLTSI